MILLSPETSNRIRSVFPQAQWQAVEALLLSECGDNLPLVDSRLVELAERIRFAVLKCSGGDLNLLKHWIAESKKDWRDTLMAAGFGKSITAHLSWYPNSEPT